MYVRGFWVPYGVESINSIYGMEGQKHGSKYKRLEDRPNREKIAWRLTDGKVKWGTGQGEKKNQQRRSDRGSKGVVLFLSFSFDSH